MLHNFKSFLNENYKRDIKKITESSVDELVRFLIYEAVQRDVLVDKISRKLTQTEIFGTSDVNFKFNKEIENGEIQYDIIVGFVHLLFNKQNSSTGLYERVEKAFNEILKYNRVYEFMETDFDEKYEQCAQNWMDLFETFELKEKPDVLRYLIKYKDIYGIPDDWIEENKHYLRGEKAGLFSVMNESKINVEEIEKKAHKFIIDYCFDGGWDYCVFTRKGNYDASESPFANEIMILYGLEYDSSNMLSKFLYQTTEWDVDEEFIIHLFYIEFEKIMNKAKKDILNKIEKEPSLYLKWKGMLDKFINVPQYLKRGDKTGLLSLTNEAKRMELFSLCKTNFISYRKKYIKHFKEKLGKYSTYINKMDWFPTIEEAPELEETLRNVYQKMLKNPLAYVIYFKYVMDEELYTLQTCFDQGLHNFRSILFFQKHEYNYPVSHTRLLSPDIVYWLYDLEEEGKIEQVLDKMVRAVERNPEKWFFNKKNYEVLPEYVKEKVKHLDRAKNTGLWDLEKVNEDISNEEFYSLEMMDAVWEGDLDKVILCVENGADVNYRIEKHGKKTDSALMWACHKGYFDIVRYLVEQGADVNLLVEYAIEPYFETPLWIAYKKTKKVNLPEVQKWYNIVDYLSEYILENYPEKAEFYEKYIPEKIKEKYSGLFRGKKSGLWDFEEFNENSKKNFSII